jgi:regulatory protein
MRPAFCVLYMEMIKKKPVYSNSKRRVPSHKKNEELRKECLKAAYRLLKYRQRSENELRVKLDARFEKVIIDSVIDHLREMRMVDDVTFAKHWREQRETLNPRSKRMVYLELNKKGIDKALINEVLCNFNDEENAYRAAKKRANVLSKEGYDKYKRRMSAFLIRRGFNYTVTKQTVDYLWRELS